MLRALRVAVAVAAASLVAGGCSEETSVFRLGLGDCTVGVPEGELRGVELVDCARDHLGEVVGFVRHESVAFPGVAQLNEEAFDRCRDELVAYAGEAVAGDFRIVPLSPTEASWNAELADRESVCVAVPRNLVDLVPFAGSLRDLGTEATTTTI